MLDGLVSPHFTPNASFAIQTTILTYKGDVEVRAASLALVLLLLRRVLLVRLQADPLVGLDAHVGDHRSLDVLVVADLEEQFNAES